jgi:hypothetical protein
LFLIFINDLDSAVTDISILKKFADDTKLGKRIKGPADAAALQGALDCLSDWAARWGMEFNVGKCKVMHIGRSNPGFAYTMNGVQLQVTEEETDVGVKVSSSLKPAAHCLKAARTAQTVLSQIGRTFHFRDRHVFVRLYKQYVRPHLEFATPAWSPWAAADKQVLEDVQRRAVNMVSGLRAGNYEDKLIEIGLETLEERRHQADMVQAFKILHKLERTNNLFELVVSGDRVTRLAADPYNMRIPVSRLDVRKQFYTQRVPGMWNRIPANIKNAKTASQFKALYRAHRKAELDVA